PETPMVMAPRRSRSLLLIVAAAIVVYGVASFNWWRATQHSESPLMRFVANLGDEVYLDYSTGPAVAISHDGLRLAYISRSPDGRLPQLSTRLLGSSKSTVLLSGEPVSAPFFSPDGRWIGFFSGGRLKRISVDGGAAVTLCDVGPNSPRGASWGDDDN